MPAARTFSHRIIASQREITMGEAHSHASIIGSKRRATAAQPPRNRRPCTSSRSAALNSQLAISQLEHLPGGPSTSRRHPQSRCCVPLSTVNRISSCPLLAHAANTLLRRCHRRPNLRQGMSLAHSWLRRFIPSVRIRIQILVDERVLINCAV